MPADNCIGILLTEGFADRLPGRAGPNGPGRGLIDQDIVMVTIIFFAEAPREIVGLALNTAFLLYLLRLWKKRSGG